MTLIKYQNPASLVKNYNNDFLTFDQLIDRFFGYNNEKLDYSTSLPPVNLFEGKDNYKIELAIPGFKKEDVEMILEKNVLTVKSKQENKNNENTDDYFRREFNYSSFERSFTLPKTADLDSINAKFNNGVLEIAINKLEEAKEKPARVINIS